MESVQYGSRLRNGSFLEHLDSIQPLCATILYLLLTMRCGDDVLLSHFCPHGLDIFEAQLPPFCISWIKVSGGPTPSSLPRNAHCWPWELVPPLHLACASPWAVGFVSLTLQEYMGLTFFVEHFVTHIPIFSHTVVFVFCRSYAISSPFGPWYLLASYLSKQWHYKNEMTSDYNCF